MTPKYYICPGTDSQEVMQLLEDKIYEHNSSSVHKHDGCLFSRIVENENKEVIAGVAGWTWAGICEITQLWVNKKVRGNGVGKMLLEEAEAEARGKGCVSILVRSYSFQAPHFYEKFGYKVQHVLNDFPKGHNYYILVKELAEHC